MNFRFTAILEFILCELLGNLMNEKIIDKVNYVRDWQKIFCNSPYFTESKTLYNIFRADLVAHKDSLLKTCPDLYAALYHSYKYAQTSIRLPTNKRAYQHYSKVEMCGLRECFP